MKINILMPTFNDCDTIEETLNTVKEQTYDNWNLIIINDGSTDNTEKVIKNYIKENKLEEKIMYVYQKNSDQLNAIKNGLNKIEDKNSIIYILHSDDLFNNKYVLEKMNEYFTVNENIDAIMANYHIIDKDSKIIGYQKIRKYKKSKSTIALQGLWLGRNLFVDFAAFRYETYMKYAYESYLIWNNPFWLISNKDIDMMNVVNVDFEFFKYRVYDNNYINNEIGLLNVLNGELRTVTNIFKYIDIPFYKMQYLLFRITNKLHLPYKTIYKNKESDKIYEKLKFIVNKRINDKELKKYPYYIAILDFFKNYENNRKIKIIDLNKNDVFLGADVRAFNNKMLNKDLPKIYYKLFKEMKKGFKIIETDKKSYSKLVNILKFLDIYNYVDIIVK